MELLLGDSRIEVNLVNDLKDTAFAHACFHGHTEIVKLMLDHPEVDFNMSLNGDHHALSVACKEGKCEVVELLLADPRINTLATSDGTLHTPLWLAAHNGSLDVVKALLSSGRDIELQQKTLSGLTAVEISKSETSSKSTPPKARTLLGGGG